MKKNVLLIFLISLLLWSYNIYKKPNLTDNKNAWEEDNLYGRVKELIEYSIYPEEYGNDNTEKPIVEYIKQYTNFGEIKKHEVFDKYGKTIKLLINEYNDNKQRIKSNIENSYLMPMKIVESAGYNKVGNLILSEFIANDTLKSFVVYGIGRIFTLNLLNQVI